MIGRSRIAGKGFRWAVLLALFAGGAPAAAPAPRLVALIVVDQLRFDDLRWGAPYFGPRGFGGLGAPVAVRYETGVTETAVGHATLSTGAWAEVHGVIGNHFWREGRVREAVDDPACPVLRAPGTPGRSAGALLAPTVGDALKVATQGRARVVSISMKDRAALFLAGGSADAAVFWEAAAGGFTESSCTARALPAWLSAFRAANPLDRWKGWVWTPSHPEAVRALAPLPAALPRPVEDLGDGFPHVVGKGEVDARLARLLRATPAGTTITLAAARAAVEALGLGARDTPDLLLISLSSFDLVGHQFGTAAPERADALLRTHDEVSAFVDFLRRRLGDRVAIALTADHGATPNGPELRRAGVALGGTLDLDEVRTRVETAMAAAAGRRAEPWVDAVEANTVRLHPPLVERAEDAGLAALRAMPGVHLAERSAAPGLPEILRRAIFPGRSGELVFEVKPLWSANRGPAVTEHGSPWRDDAEVPFLLAGPGFHLERRAGRATQVAPTLALLLGIGAPSAALDPPLARTGDQ